MCIPFERIEPTNPKVKQSVSHLKILAACEIVIAMIKMFVFKDIVGGIYELISCMILWMAWSQLSFCLCLLYIVYICVLGAITYSVSLLKPIQNSQPFFGNSGLDTAVVIFTIIFLIYYVFAAYLTFQAYKEFKAQQQEMGGAGNGFFGAQGGRGGQAVGGATYNQGGGNNQNYGTNQNYGGQGSGDQEAYIPPTSSRNVNQSQTSPNNNNTNSSGQFFTGKGVRIG